MKKDVKVLTNTSVTDGFTQQKREDWDNGIQFWYGTQIGKILGFSSYEQILTPSTIDPLISNYVGTEGVTNTNLLPTLHIQLTNFGIKSKNGVVSNDVKDVGVIPQFNDTEKSNSNTQLYFESSYENKINLNNLQTININQIDVLVTYDNNTQARILENSSTFVLKFHLGKED